MTRYKTQLRKKKSAYRSSRTKSAASVQRVSDQRGNTNRPRTDRSAKPKNNFDRYTALARAAADAGDAVQSENYYQHAEHYFRLMKQKEAPVTV